MADGVTIPLSEAQSLELADDERAAVEDDIAHAIELVVDHKDPA
jgi:hypothetical protein